MRASATGGQFHMTAAAVTTATNVNDAGVPAAAVGPAGVVSATAMTATTSVAACKCRAGLNEQQSKDKGQEFRLHQTSGGASLVSERLAVERTPRRQDCCYFAGAPWSQTDAAPGPPLKAKVTGRFGSRGPSSI